LDLAVARLDTSLEVAHVTRDSDTTFKVKRPKVNLQAAGAYCGGLPHSLLPVILIYRTMLLPRILVVFYCIVPRE